MSGERSCLGESGLIPPAPRLHVVSFVRGFLVPNVTQDRIHCCTSREQVDGLGGWMENFVARIFITDGSAGW